MAIRKVKDVYLIGPVSPYRGGISQYTENLYKALKNITNTTLISFSRQYPKILYPGKSDIAEGCEFQKDFNYKLDSNNPFTWLSVYRDIITNKPDLVLINWWSIYWQPIFSLMTRGFMKHNLKVAYICHNIYDHDARLWRKNIAKFLLKKGAPSFYIVHSQQEANKIKSFTDTKTVVKQIPVYNQFPKPDKNILTIINNNHKALNLLFIGLIRPYKGLDVLLDAYESMSSEERKKISLSVVGEVWKDKERLVKRLNLLGVKHDLKFVSDQNMVDYIANSDLVVLPYLSATGSAIIPASYYCERPVLATRIGGLVEVVKDGKTGWLVEPNDPYELKNKIISLSVDDCINTHIHIKKWVKNNSWDKMARIIIDATSDT